MIKRVLESEAILNQASRTRTDWGRVTWHDADAGRRVNEWRLTE